jgi:hypothetical protein
MDADSGFATIQRPGTWRRVGAVVALTFALGAATGGWVERTLSRDVFVRMGRPPQVDVTTEAPPPGSFMYQKMREVRALHRLYLAENRAGFSGQSHTLLTDGGQ